jgi:Right handed beta helix region
MTFKFPVLAVIFFLGSVAMAGAQASRTWVSGVGDDANPCSRTAPCKTFDGAISKTAAGGEINALDPGGFGAVTITKAITIDGGGTFASVLVSGTHGIVVSAGAADVVTIRNVTINGNNTGLNGIHFVSGAALHVERCEIFGFAGMGIDAEPAGGSMMYVLDTVLRNNDNGGILIHPGAYLGGLLDRVRLDGNWYGVRAENNANVTIRDSVAAGNSSHGFHAFSTGGGVLINLENSMAVNNSGAGVATSGAAAGISISNTTIMSNAQGINTSAEGLGQRGNVYSFGNNKIIGNATDGAPTLAWPLY